MGIARFSLKCEPRSLCELWFESLFPAKGKKKDHRMMVNGIFAKSEDTHTLRLTSELADLRVGYANPARFASCGENPLFLCQNEKKHRFCGASFWQGNRDSNPNIQSQSLLCCRYTIPLNARFFRTHYILTQFGRFVKGFLKLFVKI